MGPLLIRPVEPPLFCLPVSSESEPVTGQPDTRACRCPFLVGQPEGSELLVEITKRATAFLVGLQEVGDCLGGDLLQFAAQEGAFFEESDERVERLAAEYREGTLLSGELKEIAAEAIADFLESHQERRAALADLDEELAPFRLTDEERATVRSRVGLPDGGLG